MQILHLRSTVINSVALDISHYGTDKAILVAGNVKSSPRARGVVQTAPSLGRSIYWALPSETAPSVRGALIYKAREQEAWGVFTSAIPFQGVPFMSPPWLAKATGMRSIIHSGVLKKKSAIKALCTGHSCVNNFSVFLQWRGKGREQSEFSGCCIGAPVSYETFCTPFTESRIWWKPRVRFGEEREFYTSLNYRFCTFGGNADTWYLTFQA